MERFGQGDLIVLLLGCLVGIAGFMAVALWGLNEKVAQLITKVDGHEKRHDDHEDRIRALERVS